MRFSSVSLDLLSKTIDFKREKRKIMFILRFQKLTLKARKYCYCIFFCWYFWCLEEFCFYHSYFCYWERPRGALYYSCSILHSPFKYMVSIWILGGFLLFYVVLLFQGTGKSNPGSCT